MALTCSASHRITPDNMNDQPHCPLFTIIPPEVRNRIYEFSLEYGDTDPSTRPAYRKRALYYRPGFQRPRRINTALLQTCRRIYFEAYLVPIATNEHTFWLHRAPPHVKNAASPEQYFGRMTPDQRAAVQHLHFFMQQYCLEGLWGQICRSLGGIGVRPRKITITLRHSDWWLWEDNYDLGIDPFQDRRVDAREMRRWMQVPGYRNKVIRRNSAWGYQFQHVPSLEEIEIEFETVMRKKAQLDAIVAWAAKEWIFPLGGSDNSKKNKAFVTDERTKRVQKWIGAKESLLRQYIDDDGTHLLRNPFHNNRICVSDISPGLNYSLSTLATAVTPLETEATVPAGPAPTSTTAVASEKPPSDGPEQGFDPETEEEYYVVFLTWTRQEVVD